MICPSKIHAYDTVCNLQLAGKRLQTANYKLRALRRSACTLFAAASFIGAAAQRIEARDVVTGETLPGAVVKLTDLSSGAIRYAGNSAGGVCTIAICANPQALEVKMAGYALYRDTLPGGCAEKICRLRFLSDSLGMVVITAQYDAAPVEDAVQKVRIIDRARIDAMGAQNLRDLLTNETNIRLSQDPVLGSSMSLQGMSGENVKILIDGVPVIGRQNGSIDLSQISLANVERVEIVEGPQSVNYGTNALAGVINLITVKRQEHAVSAGIDLFYESSGTYNALFRAGVQKSRNVFLLNGGRNYFDGWNDGHAPFRYEVPRLADSSRVLQWKPREQYFATAQWIRYTDRGQFGLSTDLFHEKITNRGAPRAPYGETAFDDYYRTLRSTTTFYSRFRLNERQRIDVQAVYSLYNRTKNTYYSDLTTLEQQLVADASMQDTSVFDLYMLRATFFRSGDSLKLSYEAGIDFQYESATGLRIRGGKQTIGDFAGFASAQYQPWEWLTLRPGVRWSYNTGYASQPSPSLNVLIRLHENWKLRMSWARGFRSPSLKELYFYFVDVNHNIRGNEALVAEHSNNYMGSLLWKHVREKATWKIDAGGFYNDVFNLITLAVVQGTEYAYVNIGRAQTAGISGGIDVRMRSLQAGASFVYAGRNNAIDGGQLMSGFAWAPEAKFSLLWKEKKSGITAAAFVKYTGRLPQFYLDANNDVQRLYAGAYTIADVSFSRRFLHDKLLLETGVRNLFNVRSVAMQSSGSAHSDGSGFSPVANGTNYFFRVQYRFDFDKRSEE